MRRTRSDITHSRPATAGLFLSGNCHKVNTPLFTLHRIFTLYHYEIIDKKAKMNSVNSKTEKNFLSPRAPPDRAHPERAKRTKVKSRLFTLHQLITT
ncbi:MULTISPECIES: hypothetical protein [Enterobacter cloacae complex]|uniref:hypothetical protein n=1 Tax=Enterobacter cloacae complex TaxID=354276 RepID=UPI0015705323|nr:MULTISPECIES: hypothetical protein [Enterobacter cloacae complex]